MLFACEGDPYDADDASTEASLRRHGHQVTPSCKPAMHDWLNEGGKAFATHFHYTWFANGPTDFRNVANWLGPSVGNQNIQGAIDTSFAKGQAFHTWLEDVGALGTSGLLSMTGVATSVLGVNAQTSHRWIYDNANGLPKYLSFETPIGGTGGADSYYCGKAVFTDLHAGGAPMGDVPGSCMVSALSEQEKALEFLFFDLASCVSETVTK